jgi:hypothetical protein
MTEERPAMAEARRLLKARKGPPTENDRPQRPSKPPRVLDGQIDLYGRVHEAPVQPRPEWEEQ